VILWDYTLPPIAEKLGEGLGPEATWEAPEAEAKMTFCGPFPELSGRIYKNPGQIVGVAADKRQLKLMWAQKHLPHPPAPKQSHAHIR